MPAQQHTSSNRRMVALATDRLIRMVNPKWVAKDGSLPHKVEDEFDALDALADELERLQVQPWWERGTL